MKGMIPTRIRKRDFDSDVSHAQFDDGVAFQAAGRPIVTCAAAASPMVVSMVQAKYSALGTSQFVAATTPPAASCAFEWVGLKASFF